MKKIFTREKVRSFLIFQRGDRVPMLIIFTLFIGFFTACKKEFQERQSSASLEAHNARLDDDRPNIIVFVANDFGFELPSYNGGESYYTPNMDFVAANGIHFTQAYNHPDGSPSRMAILTGKYNFRNYLYWGYLPPGEKTIGNMLKDAGYATLWAGKWQLGGGDTTIHNAGFDDYITFLPFGHGQRSRRYKDPKLFVENQFLPDSLITGRYSEDMLFDYMCSFIDSNKQKPFFAVYASLLPATPWVPTPDDPNFAAWNHRLDNVLSDFKYFPGMVTYLDKILGQTIQKLEEEGLDKNTLILFTSATQSYQKVQSQWRGQTVNGTKLQTTKFGTNMPIIAYWPGTIAPGIKSETLVDFTDFLPTLADAAKIPVPTTYGTIDGVSFYDDMLQQDGADRDWVFCHWDNNPIDKIPLERWVSDTTYKLYDKTGKGKGKFYNISIDPTEQNPIKAQDMTKEERDRKGYFKTVLSQMQK